MASYSFDLTGRTALVTGASSGIGLRFALILSQSGANVVVTARREALLAELCEEIRATSGRALAVPMDVASEPSTAAAFDAAEAAFGPVDTIVANAGISHAGGALGISVEDFDDTTAVNLRGVFLTAREGARRMIAHGSVESGPGADRVDRVRDWSTPVPGNRALWCFEGRSRANGQVVSQRLGRQRDQRQHNRARVYGDRHHPVALGS